MEGNEGDCIPSQHVSRIHQRPELCREQNPENREPQREDSQSPHSLKFIRMAHPLLHLDVYQGKGERCFGTDGSKAEAGFEQDIRKGVGKR
jgi:hypothetical protein